MVPGWKSLWLDRFASIWSCSSPMESSCPCSKKQDSIILCLYVRLLWS
jgi:hypothetical protein